MFNFYKKTISLFFIFMCFCLVSIFIAKDINLGQQQNNRYIVYSIRFEYFGMDAQSLEKIITKPLEESISAMSSLVELRSTCEYGLAITTALFEKSVNKKNTYLTLRNIVDDLYNKLPTSVQKPKIYSSENQNGGVLAYAIFSNGNLIRIKNYLDQFIKPKLEGIDGVAEVLIVGSSVDEICVDFDADKIVYTGLNPDAIGTLIQDANNIGNLSCIKDREKEHLIIVDTKIKNINDIRQLPVSTGKSIARLDNFAKVDIKNRKQREIFRVNGEECISIVIKAAFDGNFIKISKECNEIMRTSDLTPENYAVLYDFGIEYKKLLKNVFIALIQSFFVIVLLIPFFYNNLKLMFLVMIVMFSSGLWTISQLQMFGFSLNQNTLSGIGIALGLVVDTPFVITEIAEQKKDFLSFINSLEKILPSIFSSCLTTVLALIPLFFLDSLVPGIKSISLVITLMLCNSCIISCIFFPCYIYDSKRKERKKILYFDVLTKYNQKFYSFLSFFICKKCLKKNALSLFLLIFFSIIPLFLFFIIGKNISFELETTVLNCVIEHESGLSSLVIDEESKNFINKISNIDGVQFVSSQSNIGNMEIEIGYDEKVILKQDLINQIKKFEKNLPRGFLYISNFEFKSKQNYKTHKVQVAILGDEINLCKEYAKNIVQELSLNSSVEQTVLNFKESADFLQIRPDRNKLSITNLSMENIANVLRWLLFGPVVDKWLDSEDEKDIRVSGDFEDNTKMEDIEMIEIPVFTNKGNTGIQLGILADIERKKDIGKIFRLDNRPCAYFSVHVNAVSSEEAMNLIKKVLNKFSFEKGYFFQFSKDLENLRKEYKNLFFVFCVCVIGILLLLTILTENPKKSLLITLVIPASLALPMIIKFLQGGPLEIGDIVGMVCISGLAVNNAIYICESKKEYILGKIRDKIQSIMVTTLSTVFGSIPLLFSQGGAFTSDLAFFMIWGCIGSFIVSVFIFPSTLNFTKRIT